MHMALTEPDTDEATAPIPGDGGDLSEWQELADACCEPNPFYHPALLEPALAYLSSDGQARIIEVREQGRLIGLMPVAAQAHHARYPVRNVTNWMHDQCFYGAPLLRRGHEVAAWSGLLARLDEAPWAGGFLHLIALDEDGPAALALRQCCAREGRAFRPIATHVRAMLRSDLSADAYWQAHVRSKKRKELRRLVNRLSETGTVTHRRLGDGDDLARWTSDFLELEASGWKGRDGDALATATGSRHWFAAAMTSAAAAGMLDMLRIDVDGRAIAMLVNFRHQRGGFSYKIAFDERFARFSPGILIEMDNLAAVLGDGTRPRTLDWMDSCAAPDHPMIDGLWAERRPIIQYRVALKGRGFTALRRAAAYRATGLAEGAIRFIRKERA